MSDVERRMATEIGQKEMVKAMNKIADKIAQANGVDRALYGYRLYGGTADPDGRVTPLADNATFANARMDFEGNRFVWGGWKTVFFMPRPCMLRRDGTVAYYLDPMDYAKKEDGSASDIANVSFDGNAMMEWPVIWVKRVVTSEYYEFYCSNYQADDDFHCWNNYNEEGPQEHFYTPIYNGSLDSDGKLRSISGVTPMASKNANQEEAAARLNGDGYHIETFVDQMLICDLITLITGSTDDQSTIGYGYTNGNSGTIQTGTMNAKGLFWGETTGKQGMKAFGMENVWGMQWRRKVGWVMVKGVQKIKNTPGTDDGSTAVGYNLTGDGFITISDSTPSGTSGNYISKMVDTEHGRLPKEMNGSSSTYECDACWFNNNIVAVPLCGGHWGDGLSCGSRYFTLSYTVSATYAYLGAALSKK